MKQNLHKINRVKSRSFSYLFYCLVMLTFGFHTLSAQSNYNLDSLQIVTFFAPSFSSINTEKYTYDDDDRLLSKSVGFQFSEFEYDKSLIIEIRYVINQESDTFEIGRNYQELNADGFLLKTKVTSQNIYYGEVIHRMDSIVRDKNNNVLEEFSFNKDWNSSSLNLDKKHTNQFDPHGNNVLSMTEYFSEQSDLFFTEYTDSEYNDKNQLKKQIQGQIDEGNQLYSRTSYYDYLQGRIISIDETQENPGSDPYHSRTEYEYDIPYSVESLYFILDGQKQLFQQSFRKHSQNIFFAFDSVSTFFNFQSEDILVSELTNREIANEARDSILIHEFQKGFNNGSTNFFNSMKSFYSRKNRPPIIFSLSDISVHPNPVATNGQIFVSTKAEDYDRYVIVNSLGQVVRKEPINYSFEAVINSNISSSGLYYIRFQLGEIPVTEWSRIIVQ